MSPSASSVSLSGACGSNRCSNQDRPFSSATQRSSSSTAVATATASKLRLEHW
jgi:hypothetical protein